MYNWEYGPESDDNDRWEDQMGEEYEKYLSSHCGCQEDCECLTFDQFKDKKINEIGEYYDGMHETDHEEMYA